MAAASNVRDHHLPLFFELGSRNHKLRHVVPLCRIWLMGTMCSRCMRSTSLAMQVQLLHHHSKWLLALPALALPPSLVLLSVEAEGSCW